MFERLRAKIAQIIAGKQWPEASFDPEGTTMLGVSEDTLNFYMDRFFKISPDRLAVYADVEKMDRTVEEVATALDMLADNAIGGGGEQSFTISYRHGVPASVEQIVDDVLYRTKWRQKAYEIARGVLLYGDDFRQYVIDADMNILRLMYMPPHSMCRNEDEHGLLKNGNVEGEWAFEQRDPTTNAFIAGFYPWQIQHLRWNPSGKSPYGRSLLYTARTAWRKLQVMEEALVINWITRAFARLLFILDITGKSPQEAQEYLRQFKRSLQTRRIARDTEGVQQLSIVQDIFMGKAYHEIGGRAEEGLTDVKVLDTSTTAYSNMDALEYYRSKVLMSLRTPKAYLGLEEDINAKATLIQEDRRYAKFLERIQGVLNEGISRTINLQLLLKGIDPQTVPYVIQWPTPVWTDIVDEGTAMNNFAQAAMSFSQLGVVDPEWLALHFLKMSRTEWNELKARMGGEQ